MRFGYTTGSCATAAAKAAAIGLFTGNIPDEVEIDTPGGVKLNLMILHKRLSDSFSKCAVQKDAGDDPDVTNGCEVFARVEKKDIDIVEIDGGEGVGRVTKPGLQVPVGKAAINPVPRRMIENAVRLVAGEGVGVKVVVSVPRGNKLSKRTFNPRLGIIGGISIIGTTGLVRPMSEDAFKTSLLCGLDIAKGSGFETVVLVPGSLGERSMLNLFDVQKDQVIQMSNFVGFMLVEAQKRGFKKIIVAGHPGKLIKLLRGDFQTHSSVSKPANDILLDIIEQHYCKQLTTPLSPPLQGGDEGEVKSKTFHVAPSQGGDFVVSAQSNDEGEVADKIFNNLKGISTIEGMVEILRISGYLSVMNDIAERIEAKVLSFCRGERPFALTEVGVILFNMKGSIVGISNNAKKWLEAIKIK